MDKTENIEEQSIHPALLLCILHFIVALCVWRGIGQLGHFLSSMDQHRPCLYLNYAQHFDLYQRAALYRCQALLLYSRAFVKWLGRGPTTPVQ